MTDLPDIIIRTAEEREAERRDEESFPWGLSEGRLPSGQVMLYLTENSIPDDDHETKTQRFKTESARLVFAAARILEMRKEGVANIAAPYPRIYRELSDRRLTADSYDNPNRKRERIPRSVPLEW